MASYSSIVSQKADPHYRSYMATPDFILDLRAHVGTSLLWVPGCTAVVIKEEGEGAGSAEPQILVVRRADNLRWTLVTGIIDPGEEPAIAAAREIWEETAVQARPRRLLGVEVVGPVTYDNGDESIYLDTAFAFEWESGDPFPADGENVEARFVPVSGLPSMSPRFHRLVERALSQQAEASFVAP